MFVGAACGEEDPGPQARSPRWSPPPHQEGLGKGSPCVLSHLPSSRHGGLLLHCDGLIVLMAGTDASSSPQLQGLLCWVNGEGRKDGWQAGSEPSCWCCGEWSLAAPRPGGCETIGSLSPPPTCRNTPIPQEAWRTCLLRAASWRGDPGWEHPRSLGARKVGVGVPVLAPPPPWLC